jgi:AraC-like DNA-binding protein
MDTAPPLQPAPPGVSDAVSGHWRPLLPTPMDAVLLCYWGDATPTDLLWLAQVLDECGRRGGGPALPWRWQRCEADAPLPPASIPVFAQAAPDGVSQMLGEVAIFIGPAARWFAGTPHARGQRVAMHWEDAAACEDLADDVVPSPSIIEVSGRWTSCAGGLAVVDLGLMLVQEFAGSPVALRVMDALCIDRLREPGARQRTAAAGVLGVQVPVLAEAIALMEANVEEPLTADDLARLIGVSRRHLERLFKQHLGTVPSRYYLDIRLQRARKLLRETAHSLLQVALMCGFSSGSHFSTTYSSIYGIAPREERQRVLRSVAR